MDNCPNCGTALKSGIWSSNQLINEDVVSVINEFTGNTSNAYCGNCSGKFKDIARSVVENERIRLHKTIQESLNCLPVVSTHSPLGWEYRIIEMVTGQSTTGTGIIAEFASEVTDLFGVQSGVYNSKLQKGENLCFSQIRKKALDCGANAVIATDIDYSELGSFKGMIMVCMAGTAVFVENIQIMGEQPAKNLSILQKNYQRFQYLETLRKTHNFLV